MQRDGTHPPRPPARRGAAALASALLVATLLATGCSSSAKTTIGSGASTGSSQGTADGRTGATDAGGETADMPSAEPTAVSQAPAQPSPGCSGHPELPAGATTEHLQVGADARIYRRFIPPALTPGKPVPVVINIHGLSSNIDGEVAATRFEDLAATEGFIVLTPQGLGPVPHWEGANDPSNTDLPFFGAMLDKVESDACVDIARVYSTGISNGGIMSSILACQMGNRIAAVGLVSGIRTQEGCASDKATPAMVFWGRQDVILPFFGGVGPGLKAITDPAHADPDPKPPTAPPADLQGFPPVEQVVTDWAAHDGCAAVPTVVAVADTVEQRIYSGCRAGAQVRFYVIADGGHNWPGSKVMQAFNDPASPIHKLLGTTTDKVDATKLIWSFFKGYALTA